MKIKEVSEEVIKVRIMFPSSKTSYKKGTTQKVEETYNFAPEAAPMHQGMSKYTYAPSHAPGECWERVRTDFFSSLFKRFKPNFQPKFSWKLSYKY